MSYFGVLSRVIVCAVLTASLSAEQAAAEIKITNETLQSLTYRIRYPGQAWSSSRDLAPDETDRYTISGNLEIELQSSAEKGVWTLLAGKSYRYAKAADQPTARIFAATEPGPTAKETTPPQAADQRSPAGAMARELKILAVTDETFRNRYPKWQDRIKEIVAGASRHYQDQFNIRFSVVDFQPWQITSDPKSFHDTWKQLYGIDPGDADLVIGFVGVAFQRDHTIGGYRLGRAMPFSRHAYISDSESPELATRTLVHELGHVFGAFHVADTRSIMYPEANRVALRFEFGKPMEEVISYSRDVDLRRGVESLTPESSRAIKELHSKWVHPTESGKQDPVAAGYVYQSLRADLLGNPTRAQAMAKLALNWSPEDPMAYFIIGMVDSREGNSVEAERAFRHLTSLDSKNAEAWTHLSLSLLNMADARGAGIAAERACELAPQAPLAIRAKALAEHLTNNTDAFRRDLETLKQLAPPLAKEVEDRSNDDAIKQMSTERAIRDEAARVEIRRNSIGMGFALIRPRAMPDSGRFQMGSPVGEKFRSSGERPHWVQLTHPYSIGVTEVTQGQFHRVTGGNPSEFNHGDEQLPVENVTWAEAVEFCRKLSDMDDERREGRSYRLPTEAEWEYACRAGSAEQHHFGQEPRWLRHYAWIATSRSEIRTHIVGQKAPNRWGLHDMLGNVAEWCSDWYAELPEEEQKDPVGPLTGEHHVMRGGSWSLTNGPPRSATRGVLTFQEKSNTVGFRVVLVSP